MCVKKHGWMFSGVGRLAASRGRRQSEQRGADILISVIVMHDHVNYCLYNEQMNELNPFLLHGNFLGSFLETRWG